MPAAAPSSVPIQFGQITQALHAMQIGASAALAPIRYLQEGMHTVATVFKEVTTAIALPLKMFREMGSALAEFVELVNPVAVLQWNLALRDATGVIGNILTPVLEGVTIAMRAFGDVMAKLQPVLQPLFNQFGEMIAEYGQIFAEVILAAAPLIQLLSDEFTEELKMLAVGFAFVEGAVIELYKAVAAFFGLKSRANPNATSNNTAIRNASVDSVEGFANSVFKTSLKNLFGGEGGKKPEEVNMEILAAIQSGQKLIQDLVDTAKGVAKDVSAIVDWVTTKAGQVGDAVGAVAGGGLGGIGGMIAKLFVS